MNKIRIFASLVGILIALAIYHIFFNHYSSRISPTAHYTSYVWVKNGLSPSSSSKLSTSTGFFLYWIFEPVMLVSRLTNGSTIEKMILARHQLIDNRLIDWIESGKVTQVVEIAAGLSGRGQRMTNRYPNITYIETDFQDMISLKQNLMKPTSENHQMLPLNALATEGSDSLSEVFSRVLQKTQGTVVITEGLIGYLYTPQLEDFWSRLSLELQHHSPVGVYLSDIRLHCDNNDLYNHMMQRILTHFVGSSVQTHFNCHPDLVTNLKDKQGFDEVNTYKPNQIKEKLLQYDPKSADRVTILEAIHLN